METNKTRQDKSSQVKAPKWTRVSALAVETVRCKQAFPNLAKKRRLCGLKL